MRIKGMRYSAVTLLLVSLILILAQGCKRYYSNDEAIHSIIQKVDYPREGGSWPNRAATADIWAEVSGSSATDKADPLASYKVFTTVSERCFSSFMSARVQPKWLRVTIYDSWESSLLVFITPFSHIAHFQRGQTPPNEFWNSVGIWYYPRVDKNYRLSRVRPGVLLGDFIAQLDEQASSLEVKTKTGITANVSWSESAARFQIDMFDTGGYSTHLKSQAIMLIIKPLERDASRFGLAYNSIQIRERYNNEYRVIDISRDMAEAAINGAVKPKELMR